MNVKLRLITYERDYYDEENCVRFKLVKEAYTPYSYFDGLFVIEKKDLEKVSRIQFIWNDQRIHDGLVDSLDVYTDSGITYMRIISKSFPSLFCQNQTAPGMRTDLTFVDLAREFTVIPTVVFEETEKLNYVYIKEGSSMWDAIVNFSYRLNGTYPYVTAFNHIRTTVKDPEITVEAGKDIIIKSGVICDRMKLISNISMQDIDGNYNSYTASGEYATLCNTIRQKQISLDMQYLNDPDKALDLRIKYSQRGKKCSYGEYWGYNGEDLYDLMTVEGLVTEKRIHKIVINGTESGVKTLIGTYEDGFLS
jgi:hypothetical protein